MERRFWLMAVAGQIFSISGDEMRRRNRFSAKRAKSAKQSYRSTFGGEDSITSTTFSPRMLTRITLMVSMMWRAISKCALRWSLEHHGTIRSTQNFRRRWLQEEFRLWLLVREI